MREILLIEDDLDLSKQLSLSLEKWGFSIELIDNFSDIVKEFTEKKPSLIIMDVNLPYYDGFYWCEKIREISKVPIIFLSSRDSNMDLIMGINNGGDDYITKPFNPLELIARVKSQLRRYVDLGNYVKEESNDILTYGIVKLDKIRKYLEVDGKEIKITKTEYKILDLLLSNPGRVFSSAEIYERVWEEPCFSTDTVMVHIRRIREKMEIDPKKPRYLKVIWGVGYKFEK